MEQISFKEGIKGMMAGSVESNMMVAMSLIEQRQGPVQPLYDDEFNQVGVGMDMTSAITLEDVTRPKGIRRDRYNLDNIKQEVRARKMMELINKED